jgi:hypothetical protein
MLASLGVAGGEWCGFQVCSGVVGRWFHKELVAIIFLVGRESLAS